MTRREPLPLSFEVDPMLTHDDSVHHLLRRRISALNHLDHPKRIMNNMLIRTSPMPRRALSSVKE